MKFTAAVAAGLALLSPALASLSCCQSSQYTVQHSTTTVMAAIANAPSFASLGTVARDASSYQIAFNDTVLAELQQGTLSTIHSRIVYKKGDRLAVIAAPEGQQGFCKYIDTSAVPFWDDECYGAAYNVPNIANVTLGGSLKVQSFREQWSNPGHFDITLDSGMSADGCTKVGDSFTQLNGNNVPNLVAKRIFWNQTSATPDPAFFDIPADCTKTNDIDELDVAGTMHPFMRWEMYCCTISVSYIPVKLE